MAKNRTIVAVKVLTADDATFIVGPAVTDGDDWEFHDRYRSTHCTSVHSVMPAVTRWQNRCGVKRIVLRVHGEDEDQPVTADGLRRHLKVMAAAPRKAR